MLAPGASIAFDDKDGLTSPAAVLPDPPGRLAMPVNALGKVQIFVARAIFLGDHLLWPPEVQQTVEGPAEQQPDPG